jgi:glycine/D-amino acid oxidase-like deaminating enzyme
VAGPRDAAVTVVGGGAIGTAVAYFLAREGWGDVQLLEAGQLGGGTSSQAAGFVGQARPTVERARLAMASAKEYATFQQHTGYTTDWREVGAIRIAMSAPAEEELREIAQTARITGLPLEFLSPEEVRSVYPVIERTSDIRVALWSPTDGYLQPNSLINAYTQAARDLGVTVASHAPVKEIDIDHGEVTAVVTPQGRFATELVINAAGPWAVAVAGLIGIDIPVVPVLHEYFVTEPAAGWEASLPCLRIPEIQTYARGEMGCMLCGGFENEGTSLDPTKVRIGDRLAVHPNWEALGSFVSGLERFVPGASELGVSAVFRGWPGFTPDGKFLVGPVSGVRGFAMAAGCNAHGVSGSAGIAMHLVESLQGDPSPYVQSLSPNRFLPRTWEWDQARKQAQAVYENYYPMPETATG